VVEGDAGIDDAYGDSFAKGEIVSAIEEADAIDCGEIDGRSLELHAGFESEIFLQDRPKCRRGIDAEAFDLLASGAESEGNLAFGVGGPPGSDLVGEIGES
jgi:hypothetical protein